MDEVDDFLAHYGVKGMKWGQHKSLPLVDPARRPSKETVKGLSTELALGSVGPAAAIAGLGIPYTVLIGVSAAVLSKPQVRGAIAKSAKSTADLVHELGQTKMSEMKARNKKPHLA